MNNEHRFKKIIHESKDSAPEKYKIDDIVIIKTDIIKKIEAILSYGHHVSAHKIRGVYYDTFKEQIVYDIGCGMLSACELITIQELIVLWEIKKDE